MDSSDETYFIVYEKHPEYPDLPPPLYDPYDWHIYDMEGNEIPFSQFKDKAIFLKHLNASLNDLNTAGLQSVQELYNSLKDDPDMGFIVAVNLPNDEVREWATTCGFTFPVYSVNRLSIPYEVRPRLDIVTQFWLRNGLLATYFYGWVDWNNEKTRQFLRELAENR